MRSGTTTILEVNNPATNANATTIILLNNDNDASVSFDTIDRTPILPGTYLSFVHASIRVDHHLKWDDERLE
jgi:hypothetical protein